MRLDLPPTTLVPLHLAHGAGCQVMLDGPALRVFTARANARLVPLRRLSRVVSATDVRWQTKALLACMQAGVPLTFVDTRGCPQGYCHGMLRRQASLAQLLTEALGESDWMSRHAHWRWAMECRQMQAAAGVAGIRVGKPDVMRVRSRLSQHLLRLGWSGIGVLMRGLQGPVFALVLDELRHCMGVEQFLAQNTSSYSLPDELAMLLVWDLFALMCVEKPAADAPQHPDAWAARFIVAHERQLRVGCRLLTARLENWLRAWLDTFAS